MDWSHVNFDWNQARAFLATVEEGSLSAAARALRQSQPTLGRQVSALEDALGVVLFERVGKSLHLTPAGRDMLDHARTMRDAASAMSLTAASQSQTVAGSVCVTASDVFSAYLMPDIIRQVQRLAPQLSIDILAANDIRDLQRREADIAIRHVRPEAPELFARLVGQESARLYAARDYLDRRGTPQTLDDLKRHDFVSFGDAHEISNQLTAAGLPVEPQNFRFGSRNGIVAWEMVRNGLGIAPMSMTIGAKTPDVQAVMTHMPPLRFPVWLTSHKELQSSRRIRLVFDLIAKELARRLSVAT